MVVVSSDQHWSFYLENWGATIAFLLLVIAVGVIGLALYLAVTGIRSAIRQRRKHRRIRRDIDTQLMRMAVHRAACACIPTQSCTWHRNARETVQRMRRMAA